MLQMSGISHLRDNRICHERLLDALHQRKLHFYCCGLKDYTHRDGCEDPN